MILYPKLPLTTSVQKLAQRLGAMSIDACYTQRALAHPEAVYSATGGSKAAISDLERLVGRLSEVATKNGFPAEAKRAHIQTDREWAVVLHQEMSISPHEASNDGIWHFICCVLVPDLVRWRWGEVTDGGISERWITVRRTGRNCFGRLWWRGELLRSPDGGYDLLNELGEDEQVQMMERPHLVGHRELTHQTALALKFHPRAKAESNRSELFRDVQKRLYRLGAFIEFEALERKTIALMVSDVFDQAAEARKNL